MFIKKGGCPQRQVVLSSEGPQMRGCPLIKGSPEKEVVFSSEDGQNRSCPLIRGSPDESVLSSEGPQMRGLTDQIHQVPQHYNKISQTKYKY